MCYAMSMARPKSFDEDAVLNQAMELFWDHGYEGTSLADLETRLGLGRQSLYNAFGDKHALFLKALDRYRGNVGEAALARLTAQGAGLAAIRAFFRWSIESLTAPDGRRGCLVTNTISERAGQDPDALLRCNQSRDVLERGFRRALVQAKDRGELADTLDVEATAMLLVVQTYGLNVMAKSGASAGELHAAVEALLAGLG
jgi:TetR/AcrR family transcriptional regulator, transcriptional repressor for nem operon